MTQRNLPLVVLWSFGALISFSTTAIAARTLAASLGVFEILAVRSALGLAILGLAFASPRLRPKLRLRRPLLHLLRNVPHMLGQAGWAYAVLALPLSTAFALEFTAPLWVTVMAVLFLGERMSVPRAGAVILGLVGVIVVLRPGLEAFQPAALAMLAAAFTFGIVGVVTKELTKTETTLSILFWMNAIQFPLNLLGSDPGFVLRLAPTDAWAVLALGVSGVASHLCFTQAYRYGDATVVVPLDFMRISTIAFVGWLLYGERLDLFVFLGAAIMVSGIVWSLASEARRPPSFSQAPSESGKP